MQHKTPKYHAQATGAAKSCSQHGITIQRNPSEAAIGFYWETSLYWKNSLDIAALPTAIKKSSPMELYKISPGYLHKPKTGPVCCRRSCTTALAHPRKVATDGRKLGLIHWILISCIIRSMTQASLPLSCQILLWCTAIFLVFLVLHLGYEVIC